MCHALSSLCDEFLTRTNCSRKWNTTAAGLGEDGGGGGI